MNKYIEYSNHMNCESDVVTWIETHLASHLEKNPENQTEIEHIIDYMASDSRPKRISRMSYNQAKSNTEKWNKTLIKKGANIQESSEDVETILDFGDGFKVVKLVGESAYKREGFLMRHCVGDYFGRDVEIYSLRDKKNMPHCTMEHGQQIKGKGNGSISPKYVGYVVKFLEHIGMTVGDSEMKNLGYVNVEKIKHKLHKDTKFFNDAYLHEDDEFLDVDGGEYCEFDIFQYKPLVSKVGLNAKFNFDLSVFLPNAIKKANESYSTAVANLSHSTAVANLSHSTAVANLSHSTAVANLSHSTAVANLYYSTAVANLSYSTAVANESYSTAVANLYYSTAVANLSYSTAVANEHSSTAVANRSHSTAVANESHSTAVANESHSTAVANESHSTAVANESHSTAVANDYSSTAVANDYSSTAVANRSCSTAVANKSHSTAVANGENSIALTRSLSPKAKGGIGSWLVMAEHDESGDIANIVSGKVDGVNLMPDTLYTVEDGEFVEVDNDL